MRLLIPTQSYQKLGWLLYCFLVMQQPLYAQTDWGNINGQLTTKDNTPVAFATVILANTTYYVTTDTKGTFRLSAPAGRYTLSVSRVGLKKVERTVVITSGKTAELITLI